LRLFVSRPGRVLSRDAILEAVANRSLEAAPRLSIVVPPLENAGGNPEKDYFADGLHPTT
jgi:TolB-like protein